MFDRTSDALGVPSVVVDDYTGAFRATKSTVNQQTNRMGEAAAELFFEMMPEQANEDFKPSKLVLEPELIVRQSTNRLKNH